MLGILAIIFVLALPQATSSEEGDHHHDHYVTGETKSNNAPIKITINPEARVSVAIAGALPPPASCGTAMELPVQIINQGYVAARLEAKLVGDYSAGVRLEFHPEPLNGSREEMRVLRVMLTAPGLTDITVAFRAQNDIPDIGGRDRVHFLMECK